MIKALSYVSLILVYSIAHVLFLRLKLPSYGEKIGTYLDDLSYAMIVGFILVLILNLPTLLRRISLFVFVLAIQFIVFAEWWNFEFYRDYIRYASIGHASDWKEIARGFSGFQSRYLAIVGILVFMIFAFFLEKRAHLLRITGRLRFVIIVVVFLLALIPTTIYTNFYKLSQIENWYRTTAIPLNYKNPVLQLFREKFIDGVQVAEITPLHVEKVNRLYDTNKTVFPFFQTPNDKKGINRKNVIFIVLESVRKYETIERNGISLTPNLNKIAVRNFSPKYYYANSNQTIKAEIALLCGVHDFLVGTSISAGNNQEVKTNCLPEILKRNGYRSYWFHGAEADFFNRDKFLPKIGFDELHDQAKIQHSLYKQGKSYTLRHWGIEDPYTFDYALEYLENEEQPFFAEILSVSNHHPFADTELNPKEDYFHPDLPLKTEEIYNRYQHMVNYTDKALGKFWRKFQSSKLYNNTVVVISGDHGIWLFPGDKDYKDSSEALFKYEAYLRMPLTIYFPDKQFTNEIDIKLSQVDVPVIISNYLGLKEATAFQSKLDREIVDQILNDRTTVHNFSYPIFSSIGDNFYYRNFNFICYPPVQTNDECEDYLLRCVEDHNVLKTDKTCVSLAGDVLTRAKAKVTKLVDYDIQTPNIVVDYFRKSIYFGLMPATEILSK